MTLLVLYDWKLRPLILSLSSLFNVILLILNDVNGSQNMPSHLEYPIVTF
jgi:hypothetical protein